MKNLINEVHLLEKAVEAFYEQTGMRIELEMPISSYSKGGDCIAILEDKTFDLFVKTSISSQNLSAVIYELSRKSDKKRALLVTRYINSNLMDKLRDAKVSCIDTAGNAFIHELPIYVFVKGNKVSHEASYLKTGRAFQYSGLKVIYAFLQNPNLVQQTYRDIAERSGVALGSVGWILSDLEQQGYVQKPANKRILMNKDKLLQRWVESYLVLKQKHLIGSFTTETTGWWKNIDIKKIGGLWGGEIAAESYTHYLQAKDGVVFISQSMIGEFIKAARLKKRKTEDVDAIRIDLVEPFWPTDNEQEGEVLAPPLLVYADLLNSNDARNLETANRIYEQYLN
jgi:hypothetical protein